MDRRKVIARLHGIVIVWAAFVSVPAAAATIDVKHSTIEKLLTDSSQRDGRKYIAGSPGSPCGGVYVRNPRVRTAGALLALEASLAGGFDLGGGLCLPLPGELQITLFAAPAYSDGMLRLRDPDLRVQGTSLGELSEPLLEGLLDSAHVDVKAKLVELINGRPSADGVTFQVIEFQVGRISLLPDRIRLDVGFALEVR